jgi:CheY-like chemotaxis protein
MALDHGRPHGYLSGANWHQAPKSSELAGLDAGADDYLVKPFEMRELGGAHP